MYIVGITGVTGLLGRNIFLELLKQYRSDLNSVYIYLFGRESKGVSFEKRIRKILEEDTHAYIGIPESGVNTFIESCLKQVCLIDYQLTQPNLCLSEDNLKVLASRKIDIFYHLASHTDWGSSASVIKKLNLINVDGTQYILNLISSLQVDKFVFSGSAYSAGRTTGTVAADSTTTLAFRNPYEETKLKAEKLIRDSKIAGKPLDYYIFRLTGIGGRLEEKPLGAVHKYDIFLGWAQFFLKLKMSKLPEGTNPFSQTLEIPMRITLNPNAGMNVVTVDYAAKMMVGVPPIAPAQTSFHLVNDCDIPHTTYIQSIMSSLGITGITFVLERPKKLNREEIVYYRSVGKIFTPYITDETITYSQDNLMNYRQKLGIHNPLMTTKAFEILLSYAKKNAYGIREAIPQPVLVSKPKSVLSPKELFTPPTHSYCNSFKVHLSDTSQYGSAYYVAFDMWISHTKENFFLDHCPDLTTLFTEQGIRSLLVVESTLKLYKEAYLHEKVSIYLYCGKLKKMAPVLKFFIVNEAGELIGEAMNKVIFMNKDQKLIPAPTSIHNALSSIFSRELLRTL